jgi:hypothetical protein
MPELFRDGKVYRQGFKGFVKVMDHWADCTTGGMTCGNCPMNQGKMCLTFFLDNIYSF